MSRILHVPTRRRIAAGAAAGTLLIAGLLTGVSAAGSRVAAAQVGPAGELANCSAAAGQRVPRGSLTRDPNTTNATQVAAASAQLAGKQRRMTSLERLKIVRPTGKITVNVYAHAITKTTRDRNGNFAGYVPTARVTQQIAVLNAAYASSGFTFVLRGLNSRANNAWYDWSDTADDGPAKRALHQGTTTDLNLYFAALENKLLGYATFPFDNAGVLDGVVILNDALPGGNAAPYNLGDTAVHEVGHWLGLFHTFQDSCSYVNDAVADTPAQRDGDNIFGCNTTDDTCSLPGNDPVRNYMSYGDDNCLNNFTAGQGLRMRQAWYSFRSPTP